MVAAAGHTEYHILMVLDHDPSSKVSWYTAEEKCEDAGFKLPIFGLEFLGFMGGKGFYAKDSSVWLKECPGNKSSNRSET